MKRPLFCSLMAFSAVLRVGAQEAIRDTNSNVTFGRSNGAKDRGTRDTSGKLHTIAVGVFHGKLKQLTDKDIVIDNQSKQAVTVRRSRKTKFLRNNKPIPPSDIDLDTPITVEVTQERNSLTAVNVSVDSSAPQISDHLPHR